MAKSKARQLSLFPENGLQVKTLYINKPTLFDDLFQGYQKIRAISYVASPLTILSIFEKFGFEQMQILVGENIGIKHYKGELQNKELGVVQKLMSLVREEKLTIYFPKSKTIHSKFYILSKAGSHRIIVGSANFSETARKAVKQDNYVVYCDLEDGNELLKTFLDDYKQHLRYARLFLQDLIQLVDTREESEEQVIRTWLTQDVGNIKGEVEAESTKVLSELSARTLEFQEDQPKDGTDEQEITVLVPAELKARENIEKKLAPLPFSIGGSELSLPKNEYSTFVKKMAGVPLLGVTNDGSRLMLHMGDRKKVLTREPENRQDVAESLGYVEGYVNSFRFGECSDMMRVQTNVCEALLYVLAAPFAHEFKKRKKSVDMYSRGPSFLYLYGPSFNGKTNFLRFCLHLITGEHLEPIAQEHFKKTRIMSSRAFATVFPLLFDDVNIDAKMEAVLKNYWEFWWEQDAPIPQLVMTTNKFNPPEWANTRIKRINFDVKFDQNNIRASEELNRILSSNCDLFSWFAAWYLKKLKAPLEEIKEGLLVDELGLSRSVMRSLYEYAGRPLPEFFPSKPVERLYDIDRMEWLELFETKVLSQENQRNKLFVRTPTTIQAYEVDRYMRLLPQGVKAKRKGHTIVIEGKDKYLEWVQGGAQQTGFWKRFWNRLR